MNIFARFYFRADKLEREKRENKRSAKISTFTVYQSLPIVSLKARSAFFLTHWNYDIENIKKFEKIAHYFDILSYISEPKYPMNLQQLTFPSHVPRINFWYAF